MHFPDIALTHSSKQDERGKNMKCSLSWKHKSLKHRIITVLVYVYYFARLSTQSMVKTSQDIIHDFIVWCVRKKSLYFLLTFLFTRLLHCIKNGRKRRFTIMSYIYMKQFCLIPYTMKCCVRHLCRSLPACIMFVFIENRSVIMKGYKTMHFII